jgi:O-antigen ligase
MSVHVPGIQAPINAHNWYIEVLAEQGLVGVVLWGLLSVSLVVEVRKRSPRARAVGFPVLAALAVGSVFLEAPTAFQTVGLPAIAMVAVFVSDWGVVGRGEPAFTAGGAREFPVTPVRAR